MIRSTAFVAEFIAWDLDANTYKTGDAANITAKWAKDGADAVNLTTPTVTENTAIAGLYRVSVSSVEANCTTGTISGTSITADVIIIPKTYDFEAAEAGYGALTYVHTITDVDTTDPIAQVDVWVTTDEAGTNTIASGTTSDIGKVTFYLDDGTYYLWSSKSGYDFTNPTTIIVASGSLAGASTGEAADAGVVDLTTDSYVTTLAEGDTWFAGRFDSGAWDDASDANKSKALVSATRTIDTLNFLGEMTDDDQAHQFPRYEDEEYPDDIISACCEIALALLDGVDMEVEIENLKMVSQGYGSVRSTYDSTLGSEHIVAGVPSATAWRYLRPYLRDPQAITLSRGS